MCLCSLLLAAILAKQEGKMRQPKDNICGRTLLLTLGLVAGPFADLEEQYYCCNRHVETVAV